MKIGDKIKSSGRLGEIIEIDNTRELARIHWNDDYVRTWVEISKLEIKKPTVDEKESTTFKTGNKVKCLSEENTFGEILEIDEVFTPKKPKPKNPQTKDNNMLKEIFGDIEFGETSDVKLTVQGAIAIKSGDKFKTYDAENSTTIDCTGFLIDAKNLVMKLPVQDVSPTDIIFRNSKYYFIKSINENNEIIAVNITDGTLETLIPETNIFGMNFFVKIVNLMSATGTNNNPMMMFMLSKMNDKNDNLDLSTVLALTSMNGNTNAMDFQNPMMMAMLMNKNSSSSSLLPLMMMMNNKPKKPKK